MKENTEFHKIGTLDEIMKAFNECAKQIEEKDKEIEGLNNIIDKAIKHIEKVKDMYTVKEVVNQVGIPILDISIEIWKKELLDILKGSDKE